MCVCDEGEGETEVYLRECQISREQRDSEYEIVGERQTEERKVWGMWEEGERERSS